MDISTPIRTTLHSLVTPLPPETIANPLTLYLQLVAGTNQRPVELPLYLKDAGTSLAALPYRTNFFHNAFAAACMVRTIPRISRLHREPMAAALRPLFEAHTLAAEKSLTARDSTPAHFLWHFYLLVLARERLNMSPPEMLLKGTWRRAWSSQNPAGYLHPRIPATADQATQNDILALHAAYNAVIAMRELERLEPLEKLVHWHITNTSPDATTSAGPWALAAFAALDDTSFTPQHLTAHLTHLQSLPETDRTLPLTLLADALTSQEEISHV